MNRKQIIYHFITVLWLQIQLNNAAKVQNVLVTEVFALTVDPPMFNWTYEGRRDQFTYEASLADSPDLPSWVHYVYSDRHRAGFLYGVPPGLSKAVVPLDIVGLNKKSYETRVENVKIIVQEKLNTARNEVHMKIDNLNVADMFDVERMDALKDIFKGLLWKDSEDDLYVTFLESAVEMGARKPVNPKEGEGVVVRLGSEVMLSSELLQLQDEVRPLYKMQSCPRDFKRTSVERLFRDAGFALDWCSFKLIQKDINNNSDMHKSNEKINNAEFEELTDKWQPSFSRADIPVRSYKRELVMAISLPMIIMTILVLALTFILCFEHDDMKDEASDFFFNNIFHICLDWYNERIVSDEASTQLQSSSQRFLAKNHTDLGSVSLDRDHSMSPDVMLLSRNESPNSTIVRGVHCRPSPPPYVRPKYKPEI